MMTSSKELNCNINMSHIASIMRSLDNPFPRVRQSPLWRPPHNWRFVVDRILPELREKYTIRCEEWHKANPPRPPAKKQDKQIGNIIDIKLFQQAFSKYGAVIPIPELFKIGYSKEQVAKVVAHRKWYKDHEKELGEYIEKKWPGGKLKSRKIIKAVNKRMPGGVENVSKD